VIPAPRPAQTLRRRLRSAFTERLALKALAIFLALVLWFVVGARAPTEDVASVRFSPQLDSALVLRDPPAPIRALVLGRPSEILKLANTPLVIRRPIANDAPDTLVLSLKTSDVDVPEGVEVIVRDVQPHSLTLRFESTASRKVPVRSALLIREADRAPGIAVKLDPEFVTVFGPRRAVAQLRSVPTMAETLPMDPLPRLVDLDTTGLQVTVRPAQVKATLVRGTGGPPR
jgi:hypothetical protein